MLFVALVFSAVLLVAVNAAAARPSRPVLAVAGAGLAATVLSPFACMVFLPVVALQAALLCAVGPVWRWSGTGLGRFRAASAGATAAAYAVVGLWVASEQAAFARLRARFPYQPIEDRLPARPPRPAADPPHDPARLEALEDLLRQADFGAFNRAHQLEQLHEHAVYQFVTSPGFGVARLLGRPSEWGLTRGLRDGGPAPPQPADPDPSSTPPPGARAGGPDPATVAGLHADGVVDFAHPRGFGFVKDRRHVAGFQSHGFTRVPDGGSDRRWEVARLELVGLVRHPAPVVYLSDRLPQMDALRGAPTRPPDPFEADGLDALRKGEDLFVRDHRMLGAVRATRQCLGCHGGNRGDLLGAFSYTLRPSGRMSE